MVIQHAPGFALTLFTGVAALAALGAPPIILLMLPTVGAGAMLATILRDPVT
ncbi:hypothetical protein NONI108955_17240 [Nocardia ninae]|uniref:Uncharacterized protein n=2 Tax=Nocardia TaxID=1817 RepID=A0A511MHU9_9NOCA|nr:MULTISPECIES: hypothetical protein [Nocardia]GEM39657.1 hypothetical protein NN4_41760 [Nocardia ninae NBRC 108245]